MREKPDSSLRSRWQNYYQKNGNALLGLGTMLLFLVLWEVLPALGILSPFFTSSPSRIIQAGQWLFAHGLWNDIRVSLIEFVSGFTLAVIVGIPLGLLLGWYQKLNAMFDPFVTIFNTVPRVALMPLLILWLGIGMVSKVAVVFLGAVFPILINVMSGMKTIDPTLLKCAHSFGANDRQIFTSIALPNSVPFLIAGMRLGVSRGLVGIVVGELIAARAGIGYMMSAAGASYQTDKVFVGVILIALWGYLLTEILRRLELHFDTWRPGKE